MIQVKKRATKEQIEEAVGNLRATRREFSKVFCGDTVLASVGIDKCIKIDQKLHMMIIDLIDAYKDRGWEWPSKP